MENTKLLVNLALSEEKNAILEKRVKDFENLVERLSKGFDKQDKLIESLMKPDKTYHGKPYLRKAA